MPTEITAREKCLHVLVNNAGANWNESLATYPADAFQKVTFLNLHTPFLLTRGLLPLLEAAATATDPARVINIGSIDGIQVPCAGAHATRPQALVLVCASCRDRSCTPPLQPPGMSTYAYAASKAGLHHLTKVLAAELGPRRVTVNAIAPGPFMSKMMKVTLETAGAPLQSVGTPVGTR